MLWVKHPDSRLWGSCQFERSRNAARTVAVEEAADFFRARWMALEVRACGVVPWFAVMSVVFIFSEVPMLTDEV